MEIARTLIISYLVLTLSATGLAKMVNRVPASAGMVREGVFSSKTSLPVVFAVSLAEIALAIALALGFYPKDVAVLTAALFTLLAGYRLVVAIKIKVTVCSCAGYVRTDPASPAAVAGAILACAFAAALAVTTIFLGNPAGYPLSLVGVLSLIIPFIITAVGLQRRRKLGRTTSFPAHYPALGTDEIFRHADLDILPQ